ncbi:MAG TPA: hypothetical protein VMR90_06085 [Candidatus Cybelea sp.]|nr:hypothetical protein [Candidatus Cybelea sp.]
MRFLSDLSLFVVGIAVVAFLVKLFVSLRVAGKVPDWQELDGQEPEISHTDRAAGIRRD